MARYPKGSTPKLTEKLIKKIARSIRQGAYVETAAAVCCISKDTFYRWLRQAETDHPNGLFKKLSYAVTRAMAECEIRDLKVIDKAAQSGKWKAAAWRLERRFPSRWGRVTRVRYDRVPDIIVNTQAALQELTEVPPEERERRRIRLEELVRQYQSRAANGEEAKT